jgi:hypothetical protein
VRLQSLARLLTVALLTLAACARDDRLDTGPASGTPGGGTPTISQTAPPSAIPAARLDIRATRLVIPALHIDTPVQASYVAPDTSPPTPGCPAPPEGQETLTVPDQGVATPEAVIEGLDNKAWLFGHSRWLGQPGLFLTLQDLNPGDEVFLDGVERRTGAPVTRLRFVVEAFYLTDLDSGDRLVAARHASEIPSAPLVLLQTSAREDGANRPWILDRQRVTAKARNLIEGDVNDPCKYLLLFVVGRAG